MADNAKLVKDVQIKLNIVKRLLKDHAAYHKEIERDTAKIASMKEDPSIDEYNVKKLNEVLVETKGMLPIIAQKIHQSAKDLKTIIEAHQAELEGSDILASANNELTAALAIPLFY